MTRNLMPFDELNNLEATLRQQGDRVIESVDGEKPPHAPLPYKETVDDVEDLLVIAYVFGVQAVNEELETEIEPNMSDAHDVIYTKVADKTFAERVKEYADKGDTESIIRVANTELTRVYNEAELQTAQKSGKQASKVWLTMADEKVRDTHSYLDGMVVPMDADFYTFDGDHARYPGAFSLPENNVNCRCYLGINRI